jgi:hypothetical protein
MSEQRPRSAEMAPLDPRRKFSEGGAPEHRDALGIGCPACGAPEGEWCPMPRATWNLCGARIDVPRRWRTLTDEQRLALMSMCCRGCGTLDLPCHCQNDE